MEFLKRNKIYFILYISFFIIYGALLGDRLKTHSPFNHYVYLADAILHGRLHLEGSPPNMNDWAFYNGKWYVTFPPVPALILLPFVAIWGLNTNDNIIAWIIAPLSPLFLFMTLQHLTSIGKIYRSTKENLIYTFLFGVGTVYFFSAVQGGAVWYFAQITGVTFLSLFLLTLFKRNHPAIIGLFLGLGVGCRPPMIFGGVLFLYELVRPYIGEIKGQDGLLKKLNKLFRIINWKSFVKNSISFGIPIITIISFWMVLNYLRFDDPMDSGYKFLKIRWIYRIEKWGLFNYHYLARNLCAALILLPWFSKTYPYYLKISGHGLALWFTTPNYLYLLSPKRKQDIYYPVLITALLTAIPTLLYQNTGWFQFGYRFSLDYSLYLIILLAIGGRPITKLFLILMSWAIICNFIGALTFNRVPELYSTTIEFFQPD